MEPLPLAVMSVGVASLALWDVWQERLSPKIAPATPPDTTALVSVLIPARNEALRIDALWEGLAAQDYGTLEVLLLDDASEDETRGRAQAWEARMPHLRVLTGAPLPNEWVGKCWALAQIARQARGQFFLFLDADVVPAAGLVSALVAQLERERLDALTCFPRLVLGSVPERLFLPAFRAVLHALYPLHRVGEAGPARAMLNGQCWLVRRDAYAAVGGHEAVRDRVLEDVELARRLIAGGFRLRAAQAFTLLHCRMYSTPSALWEGLSKNASPGYRSGGIRSAWVGLQMLLLASAPALLLGGLARSWIWTALGGGVACASFCAASRRRYGGSPALGLLLPLGIVAYFGLSAQAFWRAWRGLPMLWKGRAISS